MTTNVRGASRRQVALLAVAQALFQTVSVMVMTIGGLAGALVTSDPRLATAPIATMFLGTALTTIPASMLMARWLAADEPSLAALACLCRNASDRARRGRQTQGEAPGKRCRPPRWRRSMNHRRAL